MVTLMVGTSCLILEPTNATKTCLWPYLGVYTLLNSQEVVYIDRLGTTDLALVCQIL